MFCNVKHPKSGVLSDITPAGERSAVSIHCRYKDNARRVLGTARSDSGFARKERKMKNTIINALWRILGIAALSVVAPSAFAFGALVIGTDMNADDGMRLKSYGYSSDAPTAADAVRLATTQCTSIIGLEAGECSVAVEYKDAIYAFVRGQTRSTTIVTMTAGTTQAPTTTTVTTIVRTKNDDVYYRRADNPRAVVADLLAECRREHTDCAWQYDYDGEDAALDVIFPPTSSSKSSGDSTGKRVAFVAGGMAVAGAIAWIFSGSSGFADASSFSPVAEYSYDGLLRYQVGTRLDWQNDKWSAYWKATKSNNIGKTDGFAFGSGAKWTGDIFSAAFNTSAIGDNSENNLSLSAKRIFGLWVFSPEYRLDYRTSETDKTLLHALSANAVWQGDKWTVRHSLGLSGESFAAFGKNATAKIQLRRDF